VLEGDVSSESLEEFSEELSTTVVRCLYVFFFFLVLCFLCSRLIFIGGGDGVMEELDDTFSADFINVFPLLYIYRKIFNIFNAVENPCYAFKLIKKLLSPQLDYDFTTGVGHWESAQDEDV
ncbi:MAG: hypothetical protein EZS28_051673, partial [Streblomastix strix]